MVSAFRSGALFFCGLMTIVVVVVVGVFRSGSRRPGGDVFMSRRRLVNSVEWYRITSVTGSGGRAVSNQRNYIHRTLANFIDIWSGGLHIETVQ